MEVYSAEECTIRPGHSYDREVRVMMLNEEIAVFDATKTERQDIDEVVEFMNRLRSVRPVVVEAR